MANEKIVYLKPWNTECKPGGVINGYTWDQDGGFEGTCYEVIDNHLVILSVSANPPGYSSGPIKVLDEEHIPSALEITLDELKQRIGGNRKDIEFKIKN